MLKCAWSNDPKVGGACEGRRQTELPRHFGGRAATTPSVGSGPPFHMNISSKLKHFAHNFFNDY